MENIPLKSLGRGVIISNSSFTVPNNSFTTVTFNVVNNDNFGTVNLVTLNDRITIPKEGWYIFACTATWDIDNSNARAMAINVDGTTIGITSLGANDGAIFPDMNVTGAWYCRAGSVVQLLAFQNKTSGTLALTLIRLQALQINSPLPLHIEYGRGAKITSTTYSATSGPEFLLTFDGVNRDDFGTVDLVKRSTKIVIPKEGWYLFFGGGNWQSNTSGERYAALKLNGSLYIGTQDAGVNKGNSNPNQNVTAMYYCNPGDYIELAIFQASGSTLTFTSANLTAIQIG